MGEQFGDGILNIPESVCIKLNQMDRNQNPLECDYFIQIIHTEIRSHDSRDIVRPYKNDHVLNTWRFNLKVLSFVLELNHLGNHSTKNSFFLQVLFWVLEKFVCQYLCSIRDLWTGISKSAQTIFLSNLADKKWKRPIRFIPARFWNDWHFNILEGPDLLSGYFRRCPPL